MKWRTKVCVGLAVVGGGLVPTQTASAHFRLEAPAAMFEQDNNGNPQKTAPCGGAGTPTNMVTTFQAGETITITIDERIFHPGHYRVVLAENDPNELPPPPTVTPVGNDPCGMVPIDSSPTYPVLADGMLLHTEAFGGPQSFQVTLPSDVTCDNCTLQVIEFMSSHAAPCFYYHCANIEIEAAPATTSSSSSASTGAGAGGATGGGGNGGTDASSTSSAGAGNSTPPTFPEAEGSCATRPGRGGGDWAWSLALLALMGWYRKQGR